MKRTRLLMFGTISIAVVLGSTRWGLLAQEKPDAKPSSTPASRHVGKGGVAVDEALLKPFSWPFPKETSLESAVSYLRDTLGSPVVLDIAALKRLEITEEAEVKLELQAVRLKTGLKLLLDQVGLTYKVVSEDNLLVLTDATGSEDPTIRILSELKILHQEVHDLKDVVEDLSRNFITVEEPGPALRKPTIIEDMPDEKGKGKPDEPAGHSRPGL